jgi:hypothetical protein
MNPSLHSAWSTIEAKKIRRCGLQREDSGDGVTHRQHHKYLYINPFIVAAWGGAEATMAPRLGGLGRGVR